MKQLPLLLTLFLAMPAWAGIPATPVMTLYKFNGDLEIPYYTIDGFRKKGASAPAGFLTQGSSIIPCLVIRNGRPLTNRNGTPYVGFEVVVDSRIAASASTDRFKSVVARRKIMTVPNHHCDNSVRYVINVRKMFNLEKAPFFNPPASAPRMKAAGNSGTRGELDAVVRAFHASPWCETVNRTLLGRRSALSAAWERFIAANQRRCRWPKTTLARAKHLDYTMRTAIYEAHLDRGCNAYGTCERNIIALSIRNRAKESCSRYQGCRFPGDFQGVSSKVSQYNIWDEFLTQISGITSCFLRPTTASGSYGKLRALYENNVDDVQRILFGSDRDLVELFPGSSMRDLKALRHYYHAPAMGKCFPNHPRVEYMSGAVASNGNDFALIANTRIQVDKKVRGGYLFREFLVQEEPERDVVSVVDNYPGFVVDARKVRLKGGSRCPAYGIPRGCRFDRIGRYRRTPPWLKAGKALGIQCRVQDRGEQCLNPAVPKTVIVGGACDTQMRPVSGVR
jgi:hypothetical protein